MSEERIVNGEVMEATEEIVKAGSGKGFKAVAGVGIAVLIGGVTYNIIKPIIAKHRAKKDGGTVVLVNPEPEIVVNPVDDETEED